MNWVGATAVALITAGCGWTLYSNVFVSKMDAVSASVRMKSAPVLVSEGESSFAERFDQISFADRFAAAGPGSRSVEPAPETLAQQDRQVAWFDPAYSMGAAPERFARRAAPPAAVEAAAAAQAATPKSLDVAKAAPTVRQLVASIPVPAQRPSELRLPPNQTVSAHELMVQRAKATVLASQSNSPSVFEKLFGKQPAAGPVLAYAGPDGGIGGDGGDAAKPTAYDRTTAVYDISAKKVYLPDGSTLEAHSGLGDRLDNPRSASEKMRGVTPPHVYDLTAREALFHGVAALRLTPVGGEGAIYGRTGLLAHTYMLGPNGDSNGCVSFKDYNAFLKSYRNGDVKRLVVVASLN